MPPPPGRPPRPGRRRTNKIILSVFGGLVAIIIIAAAIGSAMGGGAKTKLTSGGHSSPGVNIGTHVATPVTSYGPDSSSTPDPGTTRSAVAVPTSTLSEHEALLSAQGYLATQAFSKKGLIHQLSSKYGEGFPKADAIWAVNHLHVNWFAEAVKSAREYLKTQPFSRSGLISQLSSPYGAQFTVAQATYAANKVGL